MVFDTDVYLDLVDENEELKEEVEKLKKYIKWQDDSIQSLIDENKKVKDELKDSNNLIKYLQKENEELRQEIEERDYYDELDYERELYDREEGWDD